MPNLTGKAANQVVTHGDLGPLAYYSAEMLSAATVEQVLMARDEQTSGTDGGGSTATTWVARVINTVLTNTIAGASIASNLITLPAGSYQITASAPAFAVGKHKVRLYNVTTSTIAIAGSSETAGASLQTRSHLKGTLVLASAAVLRVDHWTATSVGVNGFGNNTGATSTVEVFAEIDIRKVA